MRRGAVLVNIGEGLHVSPVTKALITRAPPSTMRRLGAKFAKYVRPNADVVDKSLKRVGVVYDVFGPVRRPYVAVRVTRGRPEDYVGKTLYVVSEV